MNAGSCILPQTLVLSFLLSLSVGACADEPAERVSLWGGGGVGAFLTGDGAQFVNGHKMAMLAATLPRDTLQLRLLKGSLERTQGVPTGTRDNDVDYEGFDVVLTRKATDLPVALAIGTVRYEEAYHQGYPDQDLGGSEFVHRWGPHVSALRSWRLGRFFDVWAEADLHYAPYHPGQTILFLDFGLGAHL